ncbi:bifunctional helix-turn-helix transcriptional regulator/GNAT family N-acetyltransferase [Devosia sp.]
MVDHTGQIADIRAFNRFYTKVIGLLEEGMHESPFTLAEARIVYELGKRGAATVASELARDLSMDPGQLSRLVRRLDSYGLLSMTPVRGDKRANNMALTPRGEAVYQGFDGASNAAVRALIAPLDELRRRDLVDSMARIRNLLAAPEPSEPLILRPHRIGELGWLIHRQGLLYHLEQGWNGEFEALIARLYSDYEAAPANPPKSLWVAEQGGEIAGSVYIIPAAEEAAGTAQLRMLYVEPAFRGCGIGKRLVEEAVRFSRASGYKRIILWTQDSLVSARRIYQGAGFTLEREELHHSFGADLNGQYWSLEL